MDYDLSTLIPEKIQDGEETMSSRRKFLGTIGAMITATAGSKALGAETQGGSAQSITVETQETYETQAKGIRILPGLWRPHYSWEHIAWISPSWPSQDYLWLDFPEAIFTSQGLLYLSHINPPIPTVFQELPAVPWRKLPDGIEFERLLPNGVSFGGSVRKGKGSTVDLVLHLRNGTQTALENITLQTCAFLRGIKEFGDYTRDNKLVHVPDGGWIPMQQATALPEGQGPYRVGWRTKGKAVSDLPVMLCLSNSAKRLVAMTWFEDTLSMVSNPGHPCMHADPRFKDLSPGEEATIQGRIIFHVGGPETFHLDDYRN